MVLVECILFCPQQPTAAPGIVTKPSLLFVFVNPGKRLPLWQSVNLTNPFHFFRLSYFTAHRLCTVNTTMACSRREHASGFRHRFGLEESLS